MKKSIKKDNIILWGTSISPYVRKVMIALAEKNIPYTQNEILPTALLNATQQMVPKAFSLSSPLGKIPAIQIGDDRLSESAVITKYLDKKFSSGNHLYPTTDIAYAESLWFEHYSDTILTDVCYKKIFLEGIIKPKVLGTTPQIELIQHTIKNELPPLLAFLNRRLSKRDYFAGSDFSMADIAIATQLLAIEMYGVSINNAYCYLKKHFKKQYQDRHFLQYLLKKILLTLTGENHVHNNENR